MLPTYNSFDAFKTQQLVICLLPLPRYLWCGSSDSNIFALPLMGLMICSSYDLIFYCDAI